MNQAGDISGSRCHAMFAAGTVLLLLLAAAACAPVAAPLPTPSATRIKQGNPSNVAKLESNLQGLVEDRLAGKDAAQAARARGLTLNERQEVLVDVYINGSLEQANARLSQLGMTVRATNEAFNVVEGFLPIDRVPAAARLEEVKAILPVRGSGTDQIKP